MQFDSNLSAHNVIRLGVDERKQWQVSLKFIFDANKLI